MERERNSLQARLTALEAESASLKGKISVRDAEWRSLTEKSHDLETECTTLESDLTMLGWL